MKIFAVDIKMPYNSEQNAAAKEVLSQILEKHPNVRVEPDIYNGIALVAEQDLGLFLADFPFSEYSREVPVAAKVTLVLDVNDPYSKITELVARLESQIHEVSRMHESYVKDYTVVSPGWNRKTGSPISGGNLLGINELCLKEDCCTDELQQALDEGWRLLAVCPQESRRPDYVLGRYNEVHPLGEVARR